jgi:metal-dependent amidase/aminoacylase/carboxypeptidase family protein
VELEGTVRTHNSQIRAQIPETLTRVINGIASAMGAEASLNWYPGPPAVVNTPFWAQFSQHVAAEAGYVVQEAERQMGGEDFSLYLQHVPGVFVSIGSASEYGLHHPRFIPDEQLIYPAASYFARLAQQALTHLQTQHAPRQTEPVE